jgi:xylulokinase
LTAASWLTDAPVLGPYWQDGVQRTEGVVKGAVVDPLLLGIDMGTGSTKGVLTTMGGTIVATAVRKHSMTLPRPGWAEVDAEQVWWGDLVEVARELMGQVEPSRVAGMCVSGVGPCLLVTDEELRPVRPAILYGIDGRAAREIDELAERFGAEAILQRCGKALSTQAVGPKMVWFQRNEPDAWARGRRWFNSNSYVAAKLTGEYVLDHHTASQSDPLYDVRAHDWVQEWVPEVAAGLEMPRLVWPQDVVGTVTARAAQATGIPEGTPVSAGTVDAWAEAFSAGVRHPGDLMLMYGSTLFFVQILHAFRTHPKLWTTAGAEPGRYTMAAGMSTSGSLTTWVQELSGGASFEQLVAEASALPAGSDGLLMLPYFAGERTPIFDPRARGVIAGLTLRHGRGHLFRAAYEGIAFGIRQIIEFLEHRDDPIRRLIAVGGGTQGGLWTQIVSDVTGRAQQIPAQTIGASYGDALMAGIGGGHLSPETDWAVAGSVVEPRPQTREVYDELYAAYSGLYPLTRGIVHGLATLQERAFAPEGGVGSSGRQVAAVEDEVGAVDHVRRG